MASGYSTSSKHADPYAHLSDGQKLDFLVQSVRQEDDEEIKKRLHRMVYEAVTHPLRHQYELESSINYQYRENDFYTDEELQEFADRGQPPTRRNEIAPILERIAGQFIQTRQSCTFLGRNTPADDPSGAILQDYMRWSDQQNLYEFREQNIVEHGLTGGVGWLKVSIKRNELGEETEVVRARNPYTIFKDPCSTEYDPNDDAKYICEGAWMDVEDAIALWPDKEDELRCLKGGPGAAEIFGYTSVAASLRNDGYGYTAPNGQSSVYYSEGRKRVRPFEIWYKRKIKLHYLFRDEGLLALPVPIDHQAAKDLIKQLGPRVYSKPVWQDRMYVGVILGDLLIHHDVSPHITNLFPYIPFYSGIRMNGAPLALASRLIPINEAINKRESKALALMTNRQAMAEEGALDDEEEFLEQLVKPEGLIKVRDGALAGPGGPKVIIRDNLDLGQGQMALLQEDKDAMRRVSGHGNESMGMASEVRSGSGIARKQMMSNLIVMPMQNNLRLTRYMKAKLSLSYAKQYLTEGMAFQITDDPSAARVVSLTKDYIQSIKTRVYDLVITEMKDYAVLREQQAEMLLQALPALAQLGPMYMKLGIQLTELRDKEGLIKMIEEQSQPIPTKPKMSLTMTWADMSPEMQAWYALNELQSPELAKAIMQKSQDPAFMQRLKAELIQTQIREGTRATVERGKVDLSALQTATEGKLRMQEFIAQHAQPMEQQELGMGPLDQGAF